MSKTSRSMGFRWARLWAQIEPEFEALLLVVHVRKEDHNGEQIIRVISARAAEKREVPNISRTRNGVTRKKSHCAGSPSARRPATIPRSISRTSRT